jgi:hypothetical protein
MIGISLDLASMQVSCRLAWIPQARNRFPANRTSPDSASWFASTFGGPAVHVAAAKQRTKLVAVRLQIDRVAEARHVERRLIAQIPARDRAPLLRSASKVALQRDRKRPAQLGYEQLGLLARAALDLALPTGLEQRATCPELIVVEYTASLGLQRKRRSAEHGLVAVPIVWRTTEEATAEHLGDRGTSGVATADRRARA